MTTSTLEELKERKQTLESLIERFKKIYDQKMIEHEDHVQRSYFAVTTGILSILNKSTKASATYRRSLNSDIQLHRKIQLRNLFLLRMRERAFHEDLAVVKEQLVAMGYVEETVAETSSEDTNEMASHDELQTEGQETETTDSEIAENDISLDAAESTPAA